MSINYKSYEFRVYEHISQLDQLFREEDDADMPQQWKSDVKRLRQDFESKHFRVAVVGEFNRGKTTFVNALLGRNILPADYLPTTAAINRITYSDTPNAYIIMKNGQKKTVLIEELAEYVTKLSAAATENAAQIQEAVLEYPSLFCRNGVDLIDTPGMNDEDAMNQVTISRLEGIDLAIIAVDASMPFSMTECAFTCQLLESPQICQIILAVTKIDMIRERERQKLIDFMIDRVREDVRERLSQTHDADSEIMRKYHAIFDQPCVFAVSGMEALEALSCNDMELFKKSGFQQLNDRLPQIIMSSQNSNVIMNTEREISGFICKYREWIQTRRPTEQQLNEMKTAFAQISYETAAKAFVWSGKDGTDFLQDEEDMFLALRRQFIRALSEMKVLTYEELKRVFLPVTKDMFQRVNTGFHESESLYWAKYQKETLDPLSGELRQKLEDLMRPFPQIYHAIRSDLNDLQSCFTVKQRNVENFYWLHTPMPDIKALGTEWNVMEYVDPVIREALSDYKSRQRRQSEQLCTQSKQYLDEKIQTLVRKVFVQTADYIAQLKNGEEKARITSLLERLGRLEAESRELREKFLAEVG
ncbi:MAG: dynamin family protein [Butyrivibrio sp.]|nr:dynamin family protein [Butyrivibrio sp.]